MKKIRSEIYLGKIWYNIVAVEDVAGFFENKSSTPFCITDDTF